MMGREMNYTERSQMSIGSTGFFLPEIQSAVTNFHFGRVMHGRKFWWAMT